MKKLAGLILSFCSTMFIFQFGIKASSSTPNKLTKLFYHQGTLGDQVVCYFDHEPLCNFMPETEKKGDEIGRCKANFFLPLTSLANNEARQMMQKVNNTIRNNYSIQMAEVKKPVNGIQVTIEYNPEKVTCDYSSCDTITMQKGLVFSFHNKPNLDEINEKTNFVLKYAAHKPVRSPLVMLDFGHGGSDSGKVGIANILEKDINMHVGNKLATLLKKKGFRVLLTRNSDTFVSLDERTTKANTVRPHIFVSLHSNAGPATASGIETYWTSRSSLKQIDWVGQPITQVKMFHKQHDEASKLLAESIQKNVWQIASSHHPITNRKVKESVAQVLLGTEMPSALIEMGFLSNRQETVHLSDPHYQMILAQGICAGIEAYCKQLKVI
jgi:N-acetylmuramoyl-L-alanine amidase